MKHQLPHLFKQSFQRGTSLIEVLVTMVILGIGLLGTVGLHSRLQASEIEAYQRSQALLLLHDMANRLATNRNFASSYVTATTGIGTGGTCPTGTATHLRDQKEWCNALRGATETIGNSQVGAMMGGRGCVESLPDGRYMITVAWQGTVPVSAPAASIACAKNLYDSNESANKCKNDLCRRVVTTVVEIAKL